MAGRWYKQSPTTTPKELAGLMAPMQQNRISTPYFDNLRITPLD